MRKLAIVALVVFMSLFGVTSPILDASKTTGYKIQADNKSYLDLEFTVKGCQGKRYQHSERCILESNY